jgi:aspartyl-tRNA(Asn)/glutamyl-tRNA(Gln) amidotransferase subunit A
MENNEDLTIWRLAPLIRNRRISPVELTQFLLDRIARMQPAINAYITVTAETAVAQARQAEKEIGKKRYKGILHGIPISIKDLFYTYGVRTTAGSRILRRFVPKENSPLVDRLLEAGCILLGKTNLHEFAYGATNLNPHYGPVRNPWDLARMSGGSSGGSAAAVITAQAIAALGTDTGGSIRIPSAACGCVGLKPSYGQLSLQGVIPLAPSLDHAGFLNRCVMDAALMYEIAVGRNPNPAGTLLPMLRKKIKGLRIGVPKQYFFDTLQLEVRRTVFEAMRQFEELGARVEEIELKGMRKTTRLAADITAGEALAYHEKWLRHKPEQYGKDLRDRLEQSRSMTASHFVRTQLERKEYSDRLERALESVHLLLAPTLPAVAPRLDQTEVRIAGSQREIRTTLLSLTRPANLSGLPAISVPCGLSGAGLPIGLQLIGRRYEEGTILRAAYAYERATPWHKCFPQDWTASGQEFSPMAGT